MANSGIVAFGSGDSDIIFESSLKSAASITDIGTSSVSTGATFSDAGALAGSAATDKGICEFAGFATAAELADLNIEGQMSFYIESGALSVSSTLDGTLHSRGCNGLAPTNNTYLWTHSSASESGNFGRCYRNSGGATKFQTDASDATQGTPSWFCDKGNDGYSLVTVSWTYAHTEIWINGHLFGTNVRTSHRTDLFKFIYLASNLNKVNSGTNLTMSGYRYKDFVLAKRPVRITTLPKLLDTIVMGDSIANNYLDAAAASTWYEENGDNVLQATLRNEIGLETRFTNVAVSGAVIRDAGGAPIADQITALDSGKYKLAIVICGINDAAIDPLPSTTDTDLKDNITNLMAKVDQLVWCTVYDMGGNSTYDSLKAQVPEVNALINAIPAWWDANNPSRPGDVAIAPVYEAFGEATLSTDMTAGQFTGALDDFHPHTNGMKALGKTIAQTIRNKLLK